MAKTTQKDAETIEPTASEPTPKPAVQNPNSVTLSKPQTVDGKEVRGFTVREPNAGELRGLKLYDVMQMDVASMIKLLPRITQPPLTEAQVAGLNPVDILKLSGKAVSFFSSPEDMAAARAQMTGPMAV